MEKTLVDIFKVFNKKSEVIYFVDALDREVKFFGEDGCRKICNMKDLEGVSFDGDAVLLSGKNNFKLKPTGPVGGE